MTPSEVQLGTLNVLNHGSNKTLSLPVPSVWSLAKSKSGSSKPPQQHNTPRSACHRARRATCKALLLPFSVVRCKRISDYLGCAMTLHSKCHRTFQIVGNLFAAFIQPTARASLHCTYASTCKVYCIDPDGSSFSYRSLIIFRGHFSFSDGIGRTSSEREEYLEELAFLIMLAPMRSTAPSVANFLGRCRLAT